MQKRQKCSLFIKTKARIRSRLYHKIFIHRTSLFSIIISVPFFVVVAAVIFICNCYYYYFSVYFLMYPVQAPKCIYPLTGPVSCSFCVAVRTKCHAKLLPSITNRMFVTVAFVSCRSFLFVFVLRTYFKCVFCCFCCCCIKWRCQ